MKAQRKTAAKLGLAGSLLLALAMTLQPLGALAVSYVEVEREGKLTVELSDAALKDENYQDLRDADFTATLYRIAAINADGTYEAAPDFAGLQTTLDSLAMRSEEGHAETNAQHFEALIQGAMETLGLPADDTAEGETAPEEGTDPGEGETDPGTAETPADTGVYTVTLKNGKAETVDDLPTGLYLLYTPDVTTRQHIYSFQPSLVSMPGLLPVGATNNGAAEDADPDAEAGTVQMEWNYDYTTYLKPEQAPRYGKLRLTKTLTGMGTNAGKAMFVFEITAVKDGETVYHNVLSLQFDAAGTKYLEIDDIPVDATVTVQEVYSGAAWEVEGSDTVDAVIIQPAREPGKPAPEPEEGQPPLVRDTNQRAYYDDEDTAVVQFTNNPARHRYGTGVENHFEPNGDTGYRWAGKRDDSNGALTDNDGNTPASGTTDTETDDN